MISERMSQFSLVIYNRPHKLIADLRGMLSLMNEKRPEIKLDIFSENVGDRAKNRKPNAFSLMATFKKRLQSSSSLLIIALLSLIDPILSKIQVVMLAAEL